MRLEKQAIIGEIRAQLSGASFAILTDYRGLKVAQTAELRRRLCRVDSRFHVMKNAFLTQACLALQWPGVKEALDGPTAVVFGRGDIVETAKLLKAFQQEHKAPLMRAGVMERRFLTGHELAQLIELPPKPVLRGQCVGVLAAPLMRLVGTLQQKAASLVYVLQAYREHKEKTR